METEYTEMAHLAELSAQDAMKQGKPPETGLDRFRKAYIGIALEDFEAYLRDDPERGTPPDSGLYADDLDDDTYDEIAAECAVFWNRNRAYILGCGVNNNYDNNGGRWSIEERAAHDFYLTRNGHGAGFWDRPELWGYHKDRLTQDSEWFGPTNFEIGDDGIVYG